MDPEYADSGTRKYQKGNAAGHQGLGETAGIDLRVKIGITAPCSLHGRRVRSRSANLLLFL